jgi:hypothetical protein
MTNPNDDRLYGLLDDGLALTGGPDDGYRGIPRTPPAPATLTLDARQQQAIDDCGTHDYTNISGTAGVGKTFVAKEIIHQHTGVVLAATTGIASVNLGEGTTINALLKYFDTKSLVTAYTEGHLKRVMAKLRRSGVRRILIDEKSMMAGQQLTPIARTVRELNEGGIYALETVGVGENEDDPDPLPSRDADLPPLGLTLVGDFGQLPPVPDTDERTGKKIPVQFAFDSEEWPLFAEHTVRLETIYRQDAQDFIAGLHAIRSGQVQRALEFFTPTRFVDTQDDTFEGTTIFAKNDAVERYNLLRLDALKTPTMVATAVRTGKQRGDWKQIPDVLTLKEGALVMILANRREYEDEFDDRGRLIYANGDLGTLVGKDTQGNWIVTLQRTKKNVRVLPVRRENTIPLEPGRRKELIAAGANIAEVITEKGKGKSEIIGTIDYMPLRAAYGCTVHKTQGLTLDRVQVNIRDPFFQHPGMLFVALSRARTAEGLRVIGTQRAFIERCRMEPRVKPWL